MARPISKKAQRILLFSGIALLATLAVLGALLLPTLLAEEPDLSSTPPATSRPEPAPSKDLPINPIDFAALQKQYKDAVAWVRVPGTAIDYPVMQSAPDMEEDFYLEHDPAGEAKREGSIYIQRRNRADFSDPNTILYGHNMASGRMFAALHKYKSQSFFDNNPLIYVYTPGHARAYRIYSMFTYNETHLMADFDFSSDKGFEKFLQYTLNPKSYTRLVREGVRPTAADRVITLSTCTNDGNGRVLLVAVLEEDVATQ